MTTYYVIRKADGAKIYEYGADSAIPWDGMEFDTHDHVAQPDPEAVTPVIVPEEWRITKLAFRNRFSSAEKVAIEIASLDNPTADMQARAFAAALRASQLDVQAAQYIDLLRPDTRAGVQALESASLLAAGRALVILDTKPTATELWNG